ncbi:U6 snRNP-associated protein Lsm7 [Cystobasidiomycetes sp. EMM_F5]
MVDSALSYEGMEDRHRLCFETLCTLEKYTMDRKGSQADHISYLPSLFKSREAQEVDVVVVEAALQGSEVVEAAVQAVEGLDMATVNKNNENEKLFSTSQNKRVRVKFSGGREVEGVLKGWDPLLNLVLDDVEEVVRGVCTLPYASFAAQMLRDGCSNHILDPVTLQPVQPAQTRTLGLAVIRGTALVILNPVEGFGAIENPFV